MNNPLVSIIIPCYNGERFLPNFLNSISAQLYKKIEIIFVDDGSTDHSKDIFLKWKEDNVNQFESIQYYYQENSGQAAAVNFGLKKIKGFYLMWCDIDDILHPQNISKKIKCFSKNKKLSLVFSACNNINENGKVITTYRRKNRNKNLFIDLILEHNVHFCPAIYMIKIERFFYYYPDRQIYTNRGGQNWQMLLPVAHENNIAYIDEILVDYLVHSDSHSRKLDSLCDIFKRLDEHKLILTNVLKQMNINDLKKMNLLLEQKYYRLKFNYSIKQNNTYYAKKYLKKITNNRFYCYLIYFLFKLQIFKLIYK